MDIKWAARAARRLQQQKPVRRKSWPLGEFVGNDGSLFYSISHEETYNSPSVIGDYDFSTSDILANDWEPVTILPVHGWVLEDKDPLWPSRQEFFWLKKDAEKALNKKDDSKRILKKVTKNLFTLKTNDSDRYE